ncbi:hypothetical protein ACFL0Q_09750, partial [Thermodesulfobacteriota bacterium]
TLVVSPCSLRLDVMFAIFWMPKACFFHLLDGDALAAPADNADNIDDHIKICLSCQGLLGCCFLWGPVRPASECLL